MVVRKEPEPPADLVQGVRRQAGRTREAQATARAESPRAGGRESMTAARAQVRIRVAMPVASHVAERSPFNRATVRTGRSTGPVAKAVAASRMRLTMSGGTENVCVARSTHMPRARNACTASDVPVHLVGCTNQPKRRRIAMRRCAAPRASRADQAPKTTSSRYCRISRLQGRARSGRPAAGRRTGGAT